MAQVVDSKAIEARTLELGLELFRRARQARAALSPMNRWAKQVLAWSLADASVKRQMLRFIDALPSLATPQAVVSHIREYFPPGQRHVPAGLRLGLSVARSGLLTAPAVAMIARRSVEQAARQFIAGHRAEDALALLRRLRNDGLLASFDVLGEQVVSEREADAYAARYAELLDALETVPQAPAARPVRHLSIKLSGLSSRCDPIDPEGSIRRVAARLRPLLATAIRAGVAITLDMEQFELRDLTLELAKRLLSDPALRGLRLGVVIQAYLRDAEPVVESLLAWLAQHDRRLAIRLVKGAYWDSEVAIARQRGWPPPVLAEKPETDAQFERLTVRLLAARERVDVEIASHNIRSIAYAMAVAEALGVPRDDFEFQLLYGMGHTIQEAIRGMGYPVRIYTPIGELIPGMAYLVRRILENTANESFLRHDLIHDAEPESLLRPPLVEATADAH